MPQAKALSDSHVGSDPLGRSAPELATQSLVNFLGSPPPTPVNSGVRQGHSFHFSHISISAVRGPVPLPARPAGGAKLCAVGSIAVRVGLAWWVGEAYRDTPMGNSARVTRSGLPKLLLR